MKRRKSILIGTAIAAAAAAYAASAGHILAASGSRPDAGYAPKPKGSVTFAKDIASIVYRNCASCHRPGEVAPFSLLNYQDVQKRAKQIAAVTDSRFMPPWKADSHGEFLDERRLTTEQIGLIKQWADDGSPEGLAADMPPAPKFPAGWWLGEPDATNQPTDEYALGEEGRDVYQCFVLPTNYTEDRYISAMEVRPGNRAIVHHVIAFLDTSGQARKLDEKDPGPGYHSFGGVGFLPAGTLGGWAPGNMPRRLPDGVGILLPKGADIVLQVHYHKTGKIEKDRTRIGIYFAKGSVDKKLRVLPVLNPFISIPAGEANYKIEAAMPMFGDVTLLQVMPHMHLLGKEMTVTANLPDGSKKPLVKVPDYDFNWQTTYTFKEPVKLPVKSNVSLVARYDNSESNPRNPSRPPKHVTWGEQTTDEMCIAFLFYTVDSEHLTKGITAEGYPDRLGGGGRRRGRPGGRNPAGP